MTTCLNCNTEFEGKFCPECGQIATTDRITLRRLFSGEFLSGLFDLDRGFWRACLELTYRPGFLCLAYLEGKRKTYLNFIGLLLVLLAIEAVLWSFAINSPVQYMMQQMQAGLDANGSDITLSEDAIKSVLLNQKLLFVLVIPIAALVPWLLCRKLKFNWVEHMVVVSMLLSLNTLLGILTLGWLGLLPIEFSLYSEIYKYVSFGVLAMDLVLYWQLLSKGDYGYIKRTLLTAVSGIWVIFVIGGSLQFAMGLLTARGMT